MTKKLTKSVLKDFLDYHADLYNSTEFIAEDPIQIPHQFTNKADIESIGLIIATISWGNRKSIIKNGERLVDIMGATPYDYIKHASEKDLNDLNFVHRTFNAEDLKFFILALRFLYNKFDEELEKAFLKGDSMAEKIANFRSEMLAVPHLNRSEKHISNPLKGSAAKRINMYLRWMVRTDNKGVDFGLWNRLKPADLYVPLDVHTGNVARTLGLIDRKQNDWKALDELMRNLREFDAVDPCKYDFALFGIGVSGRINELV